MEPGYGDKRDLCYGSKIVSSCKMVNPELYDMVHTEKFVLVDKKSARFYDGTEDIARMRIIILTVTNN
jgi:hypothetical protein